MVKVDKRGKLTCGLKLVAKQRPRKCRERPRKARERRERRSFIGIELASRPEGMLTQESEATALGISAGENVDLGR
jgi:hypothetical protein